MQLENLGQHPQILALYAHCQQNGQHFLVPEFIDGQDLDKKLRAEGAFDEAKIRALLLDVLPTLDFIHQNQVIHRDIKPAKIASWCWWTSAQPSKHPSQRCQRPAP